MFGRMTLAIVARTNGALNGSMHHRTEDGRAFRTLNILDEHSRECLAIRVKRKLNSTEVIDALTDLFILRGVPAYIRSDNGRILDQSRFCAAPSARLSYFSFEGDGAFPAQC